MFIKKYQNSIHQSKSIGEEEESKITSGLASPVNSGPIFTRKSCKDMSDLRELIIDPEFESKLPPLTEDEFTGLKEDIKKTGVVKNALTAWNGYLIDGHNRRNILLDPENESWALSVPYQIDELTLHTREEVIIWMIDNQLNKRNISEVDRIKLTLQKKDSVAAQAKQRQRDSGGDVRSKKSVPANLPEPKSEKETREILAKEAGVSPRTFSKYERLLPTMSKEIEQDLRDGKTTISRLDAIDKIEKLVDVGDVDADVLNQIKDGETSPYTVLKKVKKDKKKAEPKPKEETTTKSKTEPQPNPPDDPNKKYHPLRPVFTANYQIAGHAMAQIKRMQAFDDDYQEQLDRIIDYINSDKVRKKRKK